MYSVSVQNSVARILKKLAPSLSERILRAAYQLENTPRPPGCAKIVGHSDLYRIRVGDYRIVYRIDDVNRRVEITIVAHRREAYRDL